MKWNEHKSKLKTRFFGAALALALLVPAGAASADGTTYYPACAASYASLVDALRSVGADASFGARQSIAALNGVAGYTGSAAQNTALLEKLKRGALVRAAGDTPLEANLAKVRYIAQEPRTCKATAAAMAVNLLRGTDVCTTAGMGGTCCACLDGLIYTGSDGARYTGVYKTDSYVGSRDELTAAISAALAAGVPIAAAVHSTAGGTRHHWVVIVGRRGDDYLIADPACGSGGTVAANVTTLSARSYAFGLADYAAPHYGYVTFTRK